MFDRVIRTAYFERDPSSLIAEAACPLLLGLRARSSVRGFLRVHWARGPHLDCVLAMDDADYRAGLLDEAAGTLAAWIARHPATTPLPVDFAQRSRHMAEAEQ